MFHCYSISVRPEAVDEDQVNFPAVLALEGLSEDALVCFSLDREAKEILASKEYVNDPGCFVITIPELSASEPTTIYIQTTEVLEGATLDKQGEP